MENSTDCNKSRKRSIVDSIEFTDLSYVVQSGGKKHILKSVSGKFCSGELTAILGVSGAGKTTLLNILIGYISKGVTGSIRINEAPRDMSIFHKISAYIMQEDLLQPYLSTEELMMIAAKLKLGDHVSLQQKRKIVIEILHQLGLKDCLETWTEKLSGGERKRLSIALEMVNNPPVIFLDEPTSGLDTVAIKKCVEALKRLTGQGRTVICTIHQPSDATFQHFNQVYFIQEGMCVYNGSTSNLVPFMSSLGYECPVNYCPADYIIETVQTVPESTPVLVDGIKNGKFNIKESHTVNTKHNYKSNQVLHKKPEREAETNLDISFPTSPRTQFCILFSRMILQLKRNKLFIVLQLFSTLLCSLAVGLIFYEIGNNGSFGFNNLLYCVSLMLILAYVYLIPAVTLFPREIELLKREYLNRWYRLSPYLLALTLKNLLLMVIFSTIFIFSTYLLSDQPLTSDRLIRFGLAGLLTAATSEGLGLAIGSVCSMTVGSIIAVVTWGVFTLFSFYVSVQDTELNLGMKIIIYTSFLRCSLTALCLSVLDDRPPLDCTDEIYCYYGDPKILLRELGMLNLSYGFHLLGLIMYLIFFRLIAFVLLRYRLTRQFSITFTDYVRKWFPYTK